MGHKPFVVGLTGSIGCGKSSLMRALVGLGAEGIDADKVAHAVTLPGGPAYDRVLADFGPAIAGADGQIDRSRLGRRVFGDPAALARLEAIVHPAVGETIRARLAVSTAPMVVIEAIKLLEAGLSRTLCDEVWVVTCPPEAQVRRLAAGRGMSADEVARRRAAQMPEAAMVAQAQRVIDTRGTLAATALQALTAWAELDLPLPAPVVRPARPSDADGMAALIASVIAEGGLTVLNRPFTPAEERAYLRHMTPRERVTVLEFGGILAGLQSLDLYATYTGAMDHVGSLGTFVLRSLRGRGLGRLLSDATFAFARAAGYRKLVINVRADNPGAQAFYTGLGFRPCGRLAEQAYFDDRYLDELLYEMFLDRA